MFIDARALDRDTVEADICVVGSGPAGLPLALELAETPWRVALLEGGGLAPERGGSRIYRVVDDASRPLVTDARRQGFLGGNANHWWGSCRALDAIDFLPRDWLPHSGWPLARDELLPYYRRARQLLGLGADDQSSAVDSGRLSRNLVEDCAVPTFGRLQQERLRQAENVRVYLHARVVRLNANAGGNAVRSLTVSAGNGRHVRLAARVFVLAAGAIENPHLLLASNDVSQNGLANGNDLVGRFFTEHPMADIALDASAVDRLSRSGLLSFAPAASKTWAQWSLSEELMREQRLSGISLWLTPRSLPWRPGRANLEARLRGGSPVTSWPSAAALVEEAGEAMRFLLRARASSTCLRVSFEQSPDADNRVRLGPRLDFRWSDEERRSHGRGLRLAAEALGLDGELVEGQLERAFRRRDVHYAWHHMGSTRMDADPRRGVVDADCRAHAVSNLFIAGSSVFPTGGSAPPTLTIVALSLRLAERLRHVLRG